MKNSKNGYFKPYFVSASINDAYGIEIRNNSVTDSRWMLVIGELEKNSLLAIPLETIKNRLYRSEVFLPKKCGCYKDSKLLMSDIRTIDASCIKKEYGEISICNKIRSQIISEYHKLVYHYCDFPIMTNLVKYRIDENNIGCAIALTNFMKVDKTAKAQFLTLGELEAVRSFDSDRIMSIEYDVIEEKEILAICLYKQRQMCSMISNLYN